MSYPLGEPTNRPKPAGPATPEWTEVSPGLWQHRDGTYKTWRDPDTGKPKKGPPVEALPPWPFPTKPGVPLEDDTAFIC